jgi:hypothetical protein
MCQAEEVPGSMFPGSGYSRLSLPEKSAKGEAQFTSGIKSRQDDISVDIMDGSNQNPVRDDASVDDIGELIKILSGMKYR